MSGVKALAELKGKYGGSWIDDGEVLLEEWAVGKDIRAVNYCIDGPGGMFKSMQLMVGASDEEDLEEWIRLRKHGAAGGSCYRWTLEPEDYIRRVQYTWNHNLNSIVEVVFQSHDGQTRVIGKGEGSKVNYEYSALQPLVGFFSYEADEGKLFAIGAYEDDCHNTPSYLPFGFESFNIPSMEEARGEKTITAMTWVNDADGSSSIEIEMIDKIMLEETKSDDKIAEPHQETQHIHNTDFIDIDITIINGPG